MRVKKTTYFIFVALIIIVTGSIFTYRHRHHKTNDKKSLILKIIDENEFIPILHTGDIICRKGNGIWSDLFRDLSSRDKRFSHVGLILVNENHNISVIHAEANDFTGVGSVYEQDLADFMYEGDGIAIYRLIDKLQEHLPDDEELSKIIKEYLGIPFDYKFDLMTDKYLYCTEFVYSVYKRFNPPINLFISTKKGKNFIPVDSCNDPQYFKEITSFDYVLNK